MSILTDVSSVFISHEVNFVSFCLGLTEDVERHTSRRWNNFKHGCKLNVYFISLFVLTCYGDGLLTWNELFQIEKVRGWRKYIQSWKPEMFALVTLYMPAHGDEALRRWSGGSKHSHLLNVQITCLYANANQGGGTLWQLRCGEGRRKEGRTGG